MSQGQRARDLGCHSILVFRISGLKQEHQQRVTVSLGSAANLAMEVDFLVNSLECPPTSLLLQYIGPGGIGFLPALTEVRISIPPLVDRPMGNPGSLGRYCHWSTLGKRLEKQLYLPRLALVAFSHLKCPRFPFTVRGLVVVYFSKRVN